MTLSLPMADALELFSLDAQYASPSFREEHAESTSVQIISL